jgi:xanthine/CO dehydrogenase XdhC/CoxF family maturation factor
MKEIRDIVRFFDETNKSQKKVALATVVHVDGSSYRRPGARMLVTDDGELTGAISGGCLEGDALRKAQLAMTQQRAMLVTYDTTDEDDATLGIGLGCNGIIQILIEPIDANATTSPIDYLKTVLQKKQRTVLVSFFSIVTKKDDQPGTCMLFDEAGMLLLGRSPAVALEQAIKEDVLAVLEKETSAFKNYVDEYSNLTAFIEYIPPVITLVAIGAGNDVQPLVTIADIIGWDTRVVDGRANYATPKRFARACQVLVSKPENVLQQLPIDAHTAFVLMTHNYNYDKAMLAELIKRKIRFVGMLGPKKKLDRILTELREEGQAISEETLQSIHGPVGLDIGAETAEEIALSIIAEIKSCLSNASGGSLKRKQDAIHTRSFTKIEERKLV